MKKYLPVLAFVLCFLCTTVHPQTYNGSNQNEAMIIRTPIWVFLEPQPGTMTEQERGRHLPARQALISLSKLILSGMTYGWKFSYTPFDKKRNINEEFYLTPVHTIQDTEKRLHITKPSTKYPYLYCWAEYHASNEIAQRRTRWLSCTYITTKGSGKGARKAETDGIYDAYKQAIYSAVRSAMRKKLKNKPRCITGEILIKNTPHLAISSGEFKAEVTIYLYIKDVIPYSVF